MGRLIKPAEYAKECGISRQAVYAKIKKGLLKAKKVDGQIFIELDSSVDIQTKSDTNLNIASKDLIASKDETIKVLKETIADLKETNNLIVGTLKSEVELLKEAFNEMKLIYRTQIEKLQIDTPKELSTIKKNDIEQNDFIELKELLRHLGLNKTERKKFKKVAKNMQKQGDFRFVIVDNEIYALKNANYSDFIDAIEGLVH